MAQQTSYGNMSVTVQVVRRSLQMPVPGSAEPRHDYSVVLTTRADVRTKSGSALFASVMVGNEVATHTFTIRHTTIPFDMRDRIRDVTGRLFRILSVEDVDLRNQWKRIHCVLAGDETKEAAR